MADKLKNFAIDLYRINAVKFGEFKTKVGLMTPVYCDLRVIVSYPKLMATLADLIVEQIEDLEKIDLICGVPYTALPIATAVSLKTTIPMVMRRKEAKDYGTRKLIEGCYKEGDNCLIVEDVVTSGSSVLETVKDLVEAGIKCTDTIVLLNREQGGANILAQKGIEMHAILTLTQLMQYLLEAECIKQEVVEKVHNYLKRTQVDASVMDKQTPNRLKMPFEERIQHAKSPTAIELMEIMCQKETNLCVAADLTTSTNLLNLAEQVGPHICALKTHIDIVEDFHSNLIKALKEIAQRHNFLLIEDRKFADIGNTVEHQYSGGLYQISQWAPLVTCHSVFGKGVLEAIKQSSGLSKRGVFLLAEGSAAGCLIDKSYTDKTIKMAAEYEDLVTGLVCQSPLLLDRPGFLQLTPGVKLGAKTDNLDQQYRTPDAIVLEVGADLAVVGRGITMAKDPASVAEQYKTLLWAAYLNRIKQ